MFGKNKKFNPVHRPEFISISNLYDDLCNLVDKYGIQAVILHLGDVAKDKISRDIAGKIWRTIKLDDIGKSDDSD